MTDTATLKAALKERGIGSPQQFQERYGLPLPSLSIDAVLALVTLPPWVTDIWRPSTDATPCVYVPQAVRQYGALIGITQRGDETDHDYNLRLRDAFEKGSQ